MQQQQGPVNADQIRTDQLNQQIRETVKQAQQAAEQAAKAAQDARAQTGHVIEIPGRPITPEIPRQVVPIATTFFVMTAFVIVFSPFVRALARRIDRSTQHQQPQMPAQVQQQLQQLSASVEAIAIEVERISEGQRFTTKLLTEKPSSLAEQGSRHSTP